MRSELTFVSDGGLRGKGLEEYGCVRFTHLQNPNPI